MSAIQELFQQAQIAEAAYARFDAFPNNPRGALEDEGFSTAQATAFLSQWRVINHIPDTASGFSATLFERLNAGGAGTGEFSLAIRGSTFDSLALDFQADGFDIFLDQGDMGTEPNIFSGLTMNKKVNQSCHAEHA